MANVKNGKGPGQAYDPQQHLNAAFQMQKRFTDFQLEAMSEILGFFGQRLQAQADFWRGLSGCSDLGQATEAQRQFWERASQDYTREAQHLSDVAKRSMDTMTQPVIQDRAA
ncbi:phasin family protein [Methylovirgula sp. 4M-Z18]|uniref:phasin family protein n=1 Tax=Methylovirgula sp. 4M-Z18 TaxID=2293567 RepID=UPI000E2FA24B|nr:phasin family protein [Methylovirgula sp. 4M-Z18]RFB81445.1 phasin family protein [Methylovirgula sp. 4M-Z18]